MMRAHPLCIVFSLMNDLKKIFTNILKVILFVGLGVFFIWLSVKDLSDDDIQMIFSSMKLVNNPFGWTFIILSAGSLICADIVRTLRARQMLTAIGYRPRVSSTFYSVMVCYLANLALPRLGEILRCTYLQRFENVPFQKSLGTVILERTIDVVCWGVLFIIATLMNNGLISQLVVNKETNMTLSEWFTAKGMEFMGNYLLFVVIAAAILLFAIIRLTRKYWINNKFFSKVAQFFKDIWKGFISIKDMPRPWLFVFLTVLMWVFYFLGTYFFFFSLPYLRHTGPGAAFTVLVFGTIAFMVSQGGLGAYPLITAGIVMLYGVSYPQGLAAGWIGWILQTAVALIIGLITLAITPFCKRRDSTIATTEE